jgi:hypothetical protein
MTKQAPFDQTNQIIDLRCALMVAVVSTGCQACCIHSGANIHFMIVGSIIQLVLQASRLFHSGTDRHTERYAPTHSIQF